MNYASRINGPFVLCAHAIRYMNTTLLLGAQIAVKFPQNSASHGSTSAHRLCNVHVHSASRHHPQRCSLNGCMTCTQELDCDRARAPIHSAHYVRVWTGNGKSNEPISPHILLYVSNINGTDRITAADSASRSRLRVSTIRLIFHISSRLFFVPLGLSVV